MQPTLPPGCLTAVDTPGAAPRDGILTGEDSAGALHPVETPDELVVAASKDRLPFGRHRLLRGERDGAAHKRSPALGDPAVVQFRSGKHKAVKGLHRPVVLVPCTGNPARARWLRHEARRSARDPVDGAVPGGRDGQSAGNRQSSSPHHRPGTPRAAPTSHRASRLVSLGTERATGGRTSRLPGRSSNIADGGCSSVGLFPRCRSPLSPARASCPRRAGGEHLGSTSTSRHPT